MVGETRMGETSFVIEMLFECISNTIFDIKPL